MQAGTVFTKAVTPNLYSSLSCATGSDVSRSSSFHTGPQSAATPHPELLPRVASSRFCCLRLRRQRWHRD